MIKATRPLFLWVLVILAVAGCDSNGSDDEPRGVGDTFAVRYEVEGTFTGICAAAWTTNGGGTASQSITMPFSQEVAITPTMRPFSIALAASCLANPDGSAGSLTARILVDGDEVQQNSGSGPSVSVTVGHLLVQ